MWTTCLLVRVHMKVAKTLVKPNYLHHNIYRQSISSTKIIGKPKESLNEVRNERNLDKDEFYNDPTDSQHYDLKLHKSTPVIFVPEENSMIYIPKLDSKTFKSNDFAKNNLLSNSSSDEITELETHTNIKEESLIQQRIDNIVKYLQQGKNTSDIEYKPKEILEYELKPFEKPNEMAKKDVNTIFTEKDPIEDDPSYSLNNNDKRIILTPEYFQKPRNEKFSYKKLPSYYLMLSKSRLTMLVCLTSAAGYGLAPVTLDATTLALSTIGVGLISASANSINQYIEVPFDSQMNRTKNRVLVRKYITREHAFGFAATCGILGSFMLGNYVNGLAASLGVANLFLYTCVYTPLKRISIINTWVGSVVGAIPPLIGWVSATGSLDYGSLILAGILYAWQFPHFNALSWNLRPDYARAGYKMMSVTHPDLCKRVALRYSIGTIGICSMAPVLGVTTNYFAFDSLPVNLYLSYLAWKFYKEPSSASSRKLFRFTLVHLPILILLMFISKK